MEWKPSAVPPQLHSCDCGSDAVEERADGIVRVFRCADCKTSLGDLMMGHEP